MSDAPSPSETMGVAPPTLVPGMRPVEPPAERSDRYGGLSPVVMPPPFKQPSATDAPQDQPTPPQGQGIRPQVVQAWINAGAPPHVAEGIADAIQGESKFNPLAMGDYKGSQPTSFGLYQHHEDRARALFKFAQAQGKSPSDPMVQTAFAIQEATQGGDKIATANWGKILASKTREEAKSAWSNYFERPAGSTLGETWGKWSEGAENLIRQRGAANDATASQLRGTLAEYQRQANAAPEGSKERDEAIAESRRLSHQLQNFMADIARHPPAEKPVDAFANFGSAATIFGLIGGLFARRHLTAALSAAGTAMQAINQNNHQQFENQMRVWQQETTLAMNMASMQQADLRALIEDKRMAVGEKQARLGNLIAEAGMTNSIGGLATDTLDGAIALQTKMAELQMQMQNHRDTLQMHYDTIQGQKSRQEALVIQGEVQRLDTQYAVQHPNATQDELDAKHFEHSTQAARAMGQAVHQPRSAPGMALQTFLDEFPKTHDGKQATTEDIRDFMATQTERIAEARSVGTRSASLEMAGNAADALIPLLKASSDKINRTEFPSINALIIAGEKGTGDPEVVRYGEMINSLRYAYARALSPTGQARVADLQRLDSILDQAWSKGQINAALDQIHISINAEKSAIAKTRSEVQSRGVPVGPTSAPTSSADTPPMPNAKKAPDGNWYVPDPDRPGKYLKVNP